MAQWSVELRYTYDAQYTITAPTQQAAEDKARDLLIGEIPYAGSIGELETFDIELIDAEGACVHCEMPTELDWDYCPGCGERVSR